MKLIPKLKTKCMLRCINNKPGSLSKKTQSLTIGKIYETYDQPYRDVCVINDLGNEVNYAIERFEVVTLQELREEKLKEIGI